ncbi:MAG: DNA repair protein RecO, partial [Bacteroidetes bacterium]
EENIFDLQAGCFVAQRPAHPHYLSERQAALLAELFRYRLDTVHDFQLSSTDRRVLLDQLVQYYQFHLEGMGEIHAHQILKAVF